MILVRNLLLLLILVMSSTIGYQYVKRMGLTNPFEVEVHNVSFSTKTCLSCPICDCDYIIDNKTTYTLEPTSKTVCDVNPLGTSTIKMRDALLDNKDTINVTLKGVFYESFIGCLKEHAKQKTT